MARRKESGVTGRDGISCGTEGTAADMAQISLGTVADMALISLGTIADMAQRNLGTVADMAQIRYVWEQLQTWLR